MKQDLMTDSQKVREYIAKELFGWKHSQNVSGPSYPGGWYNPVTKKWGEPLPDFLHDSTWIVPLLLALDLKCEEKFPAIKWRISRIAVELYYHDRFEPFFFFSTDYDFIEKGHKPLGVAIAQAIQEIEK